MIKAPRIVVLTAAALALFPSTSRPAMAQATDESWAQQITPRPDSISYVNSTQVTIRFRIAPGSTPPSDVELWYTQDGAVTWNLWTGPKETKPGFVSFEAWKEGLYGFYVILKNQYGASAPAPKPGNAPHQWVRVDQAAPAVQLLEARPSERFGENREVLIRWETRDDSLAERGTSLYYRTEQGKTFQKIAEGLEPTSAFRWTAPEDVHGIVTLKVSSIDRAGNRGNDVSKALRIEAPPTQTTAAAPAAIDHRPSLTPTLSQGERQQSSIAAAVQDAPAVTPAAPAAVPDPTVSVTTPPPVTARPPAGAAHTRVDAGLHGATPVKGRDATKDALPPESKPITVPGVTDPPAARPQVSESASREAKKRYDLGTWHRLRGESATAMVRYREALEFNADLADARNDLAGLLFLAGQHQAAEKEFERVLGAEPRHRAALKSLALVQAAQRKYRSAQTTLQKLLLIDENDAEAWLYLGDVTMFLRDGVAARELWIKAIARNECPAEVRERAQKRLAIYRGEQRTLAAAGEPE